VSEVQLPDSAYINSIIGEGTRFSGEFDLNGLLRIDGDFCGTVRTKGKVLVGKNGRAECTIYAGTVVVGGIVKGNIFAEEKVVILSTGIVLGNISSPRFIVEEGVILNGICKIVQDRRPDAHPAPHGPSSREAQSAPSPPGVSAPGLKEQKKTAAVASPVHHG
jgi:cytoskeletal protein CcmA (bactofilin family)